MGAFQAVLERFLESAPICVMVRGALEQVFAPEKLNAMFERTAERQYTRELLFSTVVDVMSGIVMRTFTSVNAAFQKKKEAIAVSLRALYDKLQRIEPATSRELVRHTATEINALIDHLPGQRRPLLPGYRVRILDGNHLAGTEHRLQVLRDSNAGALPGFALAVLDPQRSIIEDVFLCEDGHTQECTLLPKVLEIAAAKDLWVCDRGFCTSEFLFGLNDRKACFLIRQHAGHLVWRRKGRCRYVGRCETGKVYEQAVILTDPQTGAEMTVRRITVRLSSATRDGDTELHLLTNLPAPIDAVRCAELYRKRWTLENAFYELTKHLNCELNTLGYPPAALFAFCVAVASYNVLAVIKASLAAAHGADEVAENVSHYYLAEEVSGTYRGMIIALPPEAWAPYQRLTTAELANQLLTWARRVKLSAYRKQRRGPKKPARKRTPAPRKHVATKRLLEDKAHPNPLK